MSTDHTWIRLPGLFRWDEVSQIFDAETGHDTEWSFDVRAVATKDAEALYVVLAAQTPARRKRSEEQRAQNPAVVAR